MKSHYLKTQKTLIPMTSVVLIEFDQRKFPTSLECKRWLRQSDYAYLEDQKGWKLTSNPRSTFISKEYIKVWSWQKDAWKYDALRCIRPEPCIYIILADSQPIYTATDLPALSSKFLEKEQKAIMKRNNKDQSDENRRQRLSENRRQQKKKSNGGKRIPAIVDEDPIEAIENKKKASEEKRKRKRLDSSHSKKKKKEGTRVKKEKALLESDDSDIEDQAKQAKKQKPNGIPDKVLKEVEVPNDVLSKD